MSTTVIKKPYVAAVGTDFGLRFNVTDSAGAKVDLTAYTISVGLKASPNETTTYLTGPHAGTSGDGDAQFDLTADQMETLGMVGQIGKTINGDCVATLAGTEKHRFQFRVSLLARVVVPVVTP